MSQPESLLDATTDDETTTVSYSEIDTFRQCPFKHRLAYVERWTKPAEDMSALGKGTFWHKVLETHYNVIKDHQEGLGEYTVSLDKLKDLCKVAVGQLLLAAQNAGTDPELIDLAAWMYNGYVETYGLDEEWVILAVEHTAIIPLYDRYGIESTFRLKVKIDLIVLWRGRIWIIDHKSCANLPRDDRDFDFDEQFGLYTVAMRRIGKPVFGSLHNATRTKRNLGDIYKEGDEGYKKSMKPTPLEERNKRTLMNRTDPELMMIQDEVLDTCETAYGAANREERHVDPDRCKWKCSFTEACLYGRRTGDNGKTRIMLQDTGFVQDFARH